MSFALPKDTSEDEKARYREKYMPIKDSGFGDRNEQNYRITHIPNDTDFVPQAAKMKFRSKAKRR